MGAYNSLFSDFLFRGPLLEDAERIKTEQTKRIETLERDLKAAKESLKKVFVFFLNYVPNGVAFSRPSQIDCAKLQLEIRTRKRF